MKVVAISGFKRSGKDTCADYLVKEHGFQRVSFADPLKDYCASLYNVARTDFDRPERKEAPLFQYPVNPQDDFSRMLCEFMFKEFVDDTGKHPDNFGYPILDTTNNHYFQGTFNSENAYKPLYYTPRALAILLGSVNRGVTPDFWVNKAIEAIKENPNQNVVIPDLRYKSEITLLSQYFSDFTSIRINRFDSVLSNDPSELDLSDYPNFDYTVENKSTLEELYNKINLIVQKCQKD